MSALDLNAAMIDAAVRAVHQDCGCGVDGDIREDAERALTAAAPLIEAAVREQVAREIEVGIPLAEKRRQEWIWREEPDQVLKYAAALATLRHVARIARGGAA